MVNRTGMISGRPYMIRWMILYAIPIMLAFTVKLPAQAPHKAEELASDFLASRLSSFKTSGNVAFDTVSSYNDIWIFESYDPRSFVLVKKEKDYHVAGYSLNNTFLKDGQIVYPAKLCLDAISHVSMKDFNDRPGFKSYPGKIDPIIQTKWGQDCFFNFECPVDYNGECGHVAAGCVPVAMGQIIKHYSRFNKFVLEEKYESEKYPDKTVVIGNYDWEKMENEPVCIDLEVSRFLFHLGVITRVVYNAVNTSTSTYNAWTAFGRMTYLSSLRMVRSSTSQETWIDQFYKNISSFMPVFVAGSGHAFVCDGYDSEGFFHFNLGWGGSADGYYPLIGTGAPFISEALLELKPHSLVLSPVNLKYQEGHGGSADSLVWSPHPWAETMPFKYRIYQDDSEFAETSKTSYPVNAFEQGKHMIKVSAWYVNGESRWIGPVEVNNPGGNISIPDDTLRISINESLGYTGEESINHRPKSDELLSVKSIIARGPVNDLSGIEFCKGLLELRIPDNNGMEVDIGKLFRNRKLKILHVNNAELKTQEELYGLDQLVYLHLNNLKLESTDFLTETTGLIGLDLSMTEYPDTDSIIYLSKLEHLDLSHNGLKEVLFLDSLLTLQYLDLGNNKIDEIELKKTHSFLRHLHLENNELEEIGFIERLPQIVEFSAGGNQIKNLELFKPFNFLEKLDVSDNDIRLVKINNIQSSLLETDLSGNRISSIDRLAEFAPELLWLDLSDNEISELWKISIQNLEYLDLSANKLRNIGDIQLNPRLTHLDLSGNDIGDFYPLASNDYYRDLNYLNLTGNINTSESFYEFFPLFDEYIDTISLDNSFNPYCPSYPSPERNSFIAKNQVNLGWEGDLPANSPGFDIMFGEPGRMVKIDSQLLTNNLSVSIDPDKRYDWQVIARTPDSSYLSGIFRLRTFKPMELPFFDGFEDYDINSLVSLESPFWIAKNDTGYDKTRDGVVVGFRRLSGEKSLRLQGNTHLVLPLDDFSGSLLHLEFGLLIPSGNISSVRLTEISGIEIEIFFKINQTADILVNGKLAASSVFSNDKWIPVKINLSGRSQRLFVQIEGKTDFNMDWKFPMDNAKIENFEISGERSPNYPTDGYPLFYIDDFTIRHLPAVSTGPMVSTSGQPDVYPNPVIDELWIEGIPATSNSSIKIINSLGRVFRDIDLQMKTLPVRIDLNDLPAGIYWLYFETPGGTVYRKIVKVR